jgi:hypothetical protein
VTHPYFDAETALLRRPMTQPDFFSLFLHPLNSIEVPYMITSAVATEPISIAPPECVIVRKLEYQRQGAGEHHLDDVARMLRVSRALELGEVDELVVPGLESHGSR